MKSKPSDFTTFPYNSILQRTETEIVAGNIMVILKRTGNKWRKLSWKEYERERRKDKNFSLAEKQHFEAALPYCKSADTAKLFSEEWN